MTSIFSDKKYQDLWNSEADSGNRETSDRYLMLKAEEQAWVVNSHDAKMDCIDLGCGAGELLKFLSQKLSIKQALDFSGSMIEKAKLNLPDSAITFIHADPFSYLPNCGTPVWLTTGALNQYLDQHRLDTLLRIFVDNDRARSFFLFDCVDPLRVGTLTLGSSFLLQSKTKAFKSFLSKVFSLSRLTLYLLKMQGRSQGVKFKDRRFGFGYSPQYWLRKSVEMKLNVKILSSANFEYRYHVVLRKSWS